MNSISKVFLVCMLISLSYSGFAMRDPTRPPDSYLNQQQQETAKKNPFVVSAIIISKERRLAVINGKTVQVDDIVDGATVMKIESDHVRLKVSNLIVTVPIFTQHTVSIPGK